MGKLAFFFPGQGAQVVGMGKDFFDAYDLAKKRFAEADEALGYSISKLCFEGPADQLQLTEHTQPAILTVSVIAAELLREEGIDVLPEDKTLIRDSLATLAGTKQKFRTITSFISFLQSRKLKEAFYPLALEDNQGNKGEYGEIFDSDEDHLSITSWQSFEMENLMNSRRIVGTTLMYIFHRIENVVKNVRSAEAGPTLIVLDECWVFLRHERMKAKIEEWLKVLRKANASVVFATQSLSDIEKSSIASTIKDACMTKIFLPNENALSTHSKIYEGYNLSQIAIATIDRAYGQRQYLYNSKYGTRLFELNLSRLELAYVGAGDDMSKLMIEKLSDTYMDQYPEPERKHEYLRNLNKAYLKYKYDEGKISREDLEIADTIISNFK